VFNIVMYEFTMSNWQERDEAAVRDRRLLLLASSRVLTMVRTVCDCVMWQVLKDSGDRLGHRAPLALTAALVHQEALGRKDH